MALYVITVMINIWMIPKDEKTKIYLNYRLKTKLKSGDITHYNLDWFTPVKSIANKESKSLYDDVGIEEIIGKLYFSIWKSSKIH